MIVVLLLAAAATLWTVSPFTHNQHSRSITRRRSTYGHVGRADDLVLEAMIDGVARALASGAAPAPAVATAAGLAAGDVGDPVLGRDLAELARGAMRGADLCDAWVRLRDRHRQPVFTVCARAWELSHRLGCALAPSLELAADSLRSDRAARARLQSAVAGPRATMQLLTALPLIGLLLAALAGLSPQTVVLSPLALVTVAPGLGLLLAGRTMAGRLIARACRPGSIE